MRRVFWLGVMACAALLCRGSSGVAEDNKGTVVEVDGLKSAAPTSWKEQQPTSNLRYKQFLVPKVEGDKEDGEMIIFHFGGQGGSVDDNIKRWKGMFIPPQGKKVDDEEVSKVEKLKIGDVGATYLDIRGTYKYKKFPMIPDDQAELRPNYRMLAVYFDSKGGPYFMRLIAPAKTAEANKKGFDEWLKGFKKG